MAEVNGVTGVLQAERQRDDVSVARFSCGDINRLVEVTTVQAVTRAWVRVHVRMCVFMSVYARRCLSVTVRGPVKEREKAGCQ